MKYDPVSKCVILKLYSFVNLLDSFLHNKGYILRKC